MSVFGWGLLLPALAQEPAPLTPAPLTPTTASVRLVYSGNLNGVGAGRYPFYALRWLQGDNLVSDVTAHNNVLVQGDWALWAPSGRVQDTLDILHEDGPLACADSLAGATMQTVASLVVFPVPQASAEDLLEASGGQRVEQGLRACRTPAGREALVLGPAGALPSWSLSSAELRPVLHVRLAGVTPEDDGAEAWIVGRPLLDLPRLTARIASLREEGADLFVDAGSFVDGPSTIRSGELSLHRPLVMDALLDLGADVLVPGLSELIAGPDTFLEETRQRGLDYIATNWEAKDPARQLASHRMVTVDTPAGPVRIAFLGMLDPDLHSQIPSLAAQEVTITDPVRSVQQVVDALHERPDPPDAVIVLTTASGDVLEAARRYLHGVDLMMGDRTFATIRVGSREMQLRPLPAAQKAAPLTMSLDGIAVVELQFDRGGQERPMLVQIRNTPQQVDADLPADPDLMATITQTRAQVYPSLDVPLLPAFSSSTAITTEQWESIICEAVRDAVDVDAVFLPPLPALRAVPGPMTELQVRQNLPILDSLTLRMVDGAKYSSLLDKTAAIGDLVACGNSKTPGSRPIDTARVYRVATTPRLESGHILGSLLDGVAPGRVLDGAAARPLMLGDQPATVQGAALQGLRAIRDDGGGPRAILDWWVDAPSRKPPLWMVRFRELSLQLSDFQGTRNDAFSAVPETLATSPSSITLGSTADVALEYSDAALSADARVRSAYTSLRTEADDEPTESADDIRVSSSLSLPIWKMPVGTLGLVPYTELLYDTEVTPTEDDTGQPNSRQADLSLALGVSTGSWGWLTNARLGGFANRDMARLDEKPTEFGGKLEWSSSKAFSTALRWQTTGDIQLYARTDDDDESDLRVRALAESRLVLPLARYLNVNLYAQGFVLRGRVPSTEDWGTAVTLGASLDLSGAFVLRGRVLRGRVLRGS